MKLFFENKITGADRSDLIRRRNQNQGRTDADVKQLCLDVKLNGDASVREYCRKFDNAEIKSFRILQEEIEKARQAVSSEFLNAVEAASENIRAFHKQQLISGGKIETTKGIKCWREPRCIERVGLYVPAGSAPLPSTVLMLGIPAKIAGCKRIVLCSPPKTNGSIDPFILAAASIIGIDEIYKAGGAQAIAAMAYGTESIPKVDKIFGPGNRYVTAAKQFVSKDSDGAAIDMPAGPSEVLIIADDSASPEITAYDLISQAEHDADARAALVTTSETLANEVLRILPKRISEFSRCTIISEALENSFIFVTDTIESAVKFSNDYAPEHLIVNTSNAEALVPLISNAGSVFVGPFAPVTAGDYASGTNHTLPTGGTARWASGVSLDSFQKYITFQSISKSGLEKIASVLTEFARTEGLQAHARAVTSRLSSK